MNYIDIIIIGVMLFFMIKGLIKGFTRAQVERFIDEQFDAGYFVFLIDALDQMTPDNRDNLVKCLARIIWTKKIM